MIPRFWDVTKKGGIVSDLPHYSGDYIRWQQSFRETSSVSFCETLNGLEFGEIGLGETLLLPVQNLQASVVVTADLPDGWLSKLWSLFGSLL